MELTERQLRALKSLGEISAGKQTFLNVIDADELASLGLAERFGKGQFVLTSSGVQLLSSITED